ncbi:hypothetical protein ACS0TY_007685 [Phlomoides rotata]
MVYPPQHEEFGNDNRRNFDYNYQMPQVPSYYQDWRKDEAPPTFEEPCFDYSSPPLDVHYGQGYYPQNGYGIQGNSERVYYNNERGFEHDYQMPQASSHYQEWGNNEDWSHATPSNNFQPQQEFDPSISSSPYEEKPSTDEMMFLILKKLGGLKEEDEDVSVATKMLYKEMEEKDERGETRFDKVEKYMKMRAQQLENLEIQVDQKQKSLDLQMSQSTIVVENLQKEKGEEDEQEEEGPSEEEDEEVELNDEELEFIEALNEFIEEFKEIDSVELKDQETNENSHLSFFSRIYYNCLFEEEINHPFSFIVCDDDRSPLETEENDPNNEKNEDDNLKEEKEEGESHLINMSNTEQQSQEEANDELKSEMSISQPLNSSICTFFDNNTSIDFILPLDSFDHKKEVEKSLGILEQKGREWKRLLRSYMEEKPKD